MGCAITLMSKHGSNPSKFHCHCLKSIAQCLRITKDWGVMFHQNGIIKSLPDSPMQEMPCNDSSRSDCTSDTNKSKLACFVDAAHGNNRTKRGSTTGHATTHGGGTIMHQSEAQSTTALSSTDAKLIVAVTTAKNIKCVRSILGEVGFTMEQPMPICKE